ncbi:MAG: grasp-with-spasm system SPASM domain peptide maturase [Flavobacterium sp.]|uniref:grasp-with-spasm system SPASM domain peptide maturase n=1 Tax=Flavobacterium sp. TaxID=239 RepID=UPI003264B38E
MTSKNKKIKLFASCIPVKGAKRSIICDLQRHAYTFVPNDLFDVITTCDGLNIEAIKKKYHNKYDDIIEEYYQFLFKNEFTFSTENPELFPKMDMLWFEPFEITNSIIDIDIKFEKEKILSQLENLKCKFVEFRFYRGNYMQHIKKILVFLEEKKSIINSVGFVIPSSIEFGFNDLEFLINNNPRIFYFIVTGSDENKLIELEIKKGSYIAYTKDKIKNSLHCGIITNKSFVVNTKLLTESTGYNTCLNRKISIDINGNIKNCPSMSESFGNIKDNTLEEALNHPNFKKYWNINKDQIEVCKDCEFRYICTDCRAYIEDPKNQFSKPLKCGYSPYTNEWEEWSTNPLKQKAIEFYDMQELIKKDA